MVQFWIESRATDAAYLQEWSQAKFSCLCFEAPKYQTEIHNYEEIFWRTRKQLENGENVSK